MTQLILGLIISVISALISLYEKWKKKTEKEYRKKNNIAIALLFIAFIGAFISFIAGFDAIKQKSRSQVIATMRQQKIDSQSAMIYNF